MTLTEIHIDPRQPSAKRALTDCHDMHRNIMRAFADGDGACARRSLGVQYRLLQSGADVKALVLSNEPGAWGKTEANGYTMIREKSVDAMLASLTKGRVIGFDLLCVPSKKIKGEGKNSRRRTLTLPEERVAWLERKGEPAGFELTSCMEMGSFTAAGLRAGQRLSFEFFRMVGNLCITDTKKFTEAYCTGFGPEKAYGMGMMLLARRIS